MVADRIEALRADKGCDADAIRAEIAAADAASPIDTTGLEKAIWIISASFQLKYTIRIYTEPIRQII